MTVFARDFGTPQLQSIQSATVVINVFRNNFGPVFQNTPYARDLSQSISSGTSVFRVNATDADTVSQSFLYNYPSNFQIVNAATVADFIESR